MTRRTIERYIPKEIEKKWQKEWEKQEAFKAEDDDPREKSYILEMFPYPSGRMHIGHVRNYAIGDVISRYRWRQGLNVLHPMGFDAFGMPAENAAIKNKTHPREWTLANIKTMKDQFKLLGFSHDWSRQVITCEPEYYKWEQILFIEMFKKGLAYRKRSQVHWCGDCETVLANEQVVNGKCWRCENEVVEKDLDQWFFKITDYAEELLESLKGLEGGWPERVLTMQRNWIGKSQGSYIDFELEDLPGKKVRVFTTRPDTLYGVTFLSLAPEHPFIDELFSKLSKDRQKEVARFREKYSKVQTEERIGDQAEKVGVLTGLYCKHPMTGARVPLVIANFVVMSYGTGAVMAVPAHDQRDFEFAKTYDLPIRLVIQPRTVQLVEDEMTEAFEDSGSLVNSEEFDGEENEVAKTSITKGLVDKKMGEIATMFRLRDWGISRQRYWGTPIPMIHCPECGIVPSPMEELPIVLPKEAPLTGAGGSPLAQVESYVNTSCPKCKGKARRDTDTMDTFMESSWYFLRYCSPQDKDDIFSREAANAWCPVDQYIGGIEHAVLHLLYARFITKVLRDLGKTEISEPFTRLLTQGMVIKDGEKMSKSKGNVVDPDDLIERYGADTVRIFTLFASPAERDLDWSDQGVEGSYRFLDRLWRFALNIQSACGNSTDAKEEDLLKDAKAKKTVQATNIMIKEVTHDLDNFHFNTAVSEVMDYLNKVAREIPDVWNFVEKPKSIEKLTDPQKHALAKGAKAAVSVISPFASHVAEELWTRLGEKSLLATSPWPKFEAKWTEADSITVVVQVNGKVRAKLDAQRGMEEDALLKMAQEDPNVLKHMEGKTIRKSIVVPDKLVNLVVG